MTMYTTLRQRVDALPEPERSARRSLYSKWDWENKWELNAFNHQIAPLGDWKVWTSIGPRRAGATTAGMKWVEEKFFNSPDGAKFLAVLRHDNTKDAVTSYFQDRIDRLGATDSFRFIHRRERTTFELKSGPPRLSLTLLLEPPSPREYDRFRGATYDYVWADEIQDAEEFMHMVYANKQYVFTNPTKLPTETLLSRAGD